MAQARNKPPRVELTRLTNAQYRNSVADLVGSFSWAAKPGPERGLKGRYFNSEKMAKEKTFVLERIDPNLDFDFGGGAPTEEMTQAAFSIRWTGSLIAPDSGVYDFRLRTHNGALFHLNNFGARRTTIRSSMPMSANATTLRQAHAQYTGTPEGI